MKYSLHSLLSALSHLHSNNVLHRDIKPDNLLFDHSNTLKLGDFGLSRTYGSPRLRLSPEAITLFYKPPEMLLGSFEYGASSDMWSVGCVFAELLLGKVFLPSKWDGNTVDMSFNDLEQVSAIFKVFGTPKSKEWEGWEKLPLVARGCLFNEIEPMWKVAQKVSIFALHNKDAPGQTRHCVQVLAPKTSVRWRLRPDFFDRDLDLN